MTTHRTNRIFVPGGQPSLTYVDRREYDLEKRINEVSDHLCKLVAVTGPTKSGKTVLVNRVFPRTEAVWLDGGIIRDEDDIWSEIVEQLDVFTETHESNSSSKQHHLTGSAGGKAGIPYFAEGKGQIETGTNANHGETDAHTRSSTSRSVAVRAIREQHATLVIDDFHYLPRDLQGKVIRALKPLIFDGIPVIVIAIPHRRFDAVKVEREIAGRLEAIEIPPWTNDELLTIPHIGFPLLGMDVHNSIQEEFATHAYGSPHLMQQFCRDLAHNHRVSETSTPVTRIDALDETLFRDVAEGSGRVIYDKLARGPRQRSDRIQRQLQDGESADIYEVVLKSLAALQPGLSTIDYETLRASIRGLVTENMPQAHEITRVLEKMAEISAADEASVPVIDWEKTDQLLHITDPFFAFFLKWGDLGVKTNSSE